MMHPPAEAPLCVECAESEAAYLDLSCLKCLQLLVRPETTISQIFAVMRQWNPHTQRSIKYCTKMVNQHRHFFLVTRRQTNIYSGIGFAVEREGEELLAMIARLDRMCNRKILVFGGNTETDA